MSDPQGGGPYSQAGGHPDLETNFTLENPGVPEAAKNVIFNAPQGLFGNINAITNCTPADFALDQCPSELPGRADHRLRELLRQPNFLLGTAPLYDVSPRPIRRR